MTAASWPGKTPLPDRAAYAGRSLRRNCLCRSHQLTPAWRATVATDRTQRWRNSKPGRPESQTAGIANVTSRVALANNEGSVLPSA